MAGITKIHGGIGLEGVINGQSGALVGASIKFFKIAVIGAGGAIDLRTEMAANPDGGLNGAVEAILKLCPSGLLAYSVPNDNTGFVFIAVDGHAAFTASTGSATQPGLQEMIRTAAAVPALQAATVDVSLSTVIAGTTFTVV